MLYELEQYIYGMELHAIITYIACNSQCLPLLCDTFSCCFYFSSFFQFIARGAAFTHPPKPNGLRNGLFFFIRNRHTVEPAPPAKKKSTEKEIKLMRRYHHIITVLIVASYMDLNDVYLS